MRDAATHRLGEPSPLIFHLSVALHAYIHALIAAPRSTDPQFPWRPELRERASHLGTDLDRIEVALSVARRLRHTIDGLETWQRHPYRRSLPDAPVIWQRGCSRLLDYGAGPGKSRSEAAPVLVIPSLINRAYILDLASDCTLLRWMAQQGLRPFLLDWGPPGRNETDFSLENYGQDRLLPALRHVQQTSGRPVGLLGYCMGGTIAAGLAAARPDGLAALTMIGAPWDFRSTRGLSGGLRALFREDGGVRAETMLRALADTFGVIPVPLFQLLFAMVNPLQASRKFQRLATLPPDSTEARLFVALEDWLADGIAMPGRAAKDVLIDWQIRNATAKGQWSFLGTRVDPGAIRLPTLAFCGQNDTIAPSPVAEPLPKAIPDACMLRPPTGHVGMVVGSLARDTVWRPLARFLLSHSG